MTSFIYFCWFFLLNKLCCRYFVEFYVMKVALTSEMKDWVSYDHSLIWPQDIWPRTFDRRTINRKGHLTAERGNDIRPQGTFDHRGPMWRLTAADIWPRDIWPQWHLTAGHLTAVTFDHGILDRQPRLENLDRKWHLTEGPLTASDVWPRDIWPQWHLTAGFLIGNQN